MQQKNSLCEDGIISCLTSSPVWSPFRSIAESGFGESWGGVLKNFGFVDRESHILTHMTRDHSRLITESQKSTVFETVEKLVLVTKLSQGNRILNLQQ
jgi:hypothetical protein